MGRLPRYIFCRAGINRPPVTGPSGHEARELEDPDIEKKALINGPEHVVVPPDA
jgi:hypothetical protein